MTHALRFTSADLELMPDDGKRYEIIDGELYVSRQPSWQHQAVCARATAALVTWSTRADNGIVLVAPGVVFADDDDVAPDIAWVSKERLAATLGPDPHLHAAPDLVVEILSPGATNERRDREAKLKLYSRRGVREYWIIDWRQQRLEAYRRDNVALGLAATFLRDDILESELLPGFSVNLREFFAGLSHG